MSVREGKKGGGLKFLVNLEEKEGEEIVLPAFDASKLLVGCSEAEERVTVEGKVRKTLERAFYCRKIREEVDEMAEREKEGKREKGGEGEEEEEEEDAMSLFLDLQEIPPLSPWQVLFCVCMCMCPSGLPFLTDYQRCMIGKILQKNQQSTSIFSGYFHFRSIFFFFLFLSFSFPSPFPNHPTPSPLLPEMSF